MWVGVEVQGAGHWSYVIIELRTSGQVYTEMLCGGRIAGLKEHVLEVIRWIQPVVVVVVNNTEQKLIFLSSCCATVQRATVQSATVLSATHVNLNKSKCK